MATVLKSLNSALHAMMATDDRVVVMGEDILDPYGGAFKVVKGLSTEYPDRVLPTPIAEGGFVGVAAGMSMRGLRPVVEIMFGDFLMLAGDQLLNHIAKYRWMYNDQVEVPIVIRAAMGGRRGYGPTHSQTIEKHFLGIPGIIFVAPSAFHDPGALLTHATLEDDNPVVFVENKLMYARRLRRAGGDDMQDVSVRDCGSDYPTVSLSYDSFDSCDATIVAYGGMAELALEAAEQLLMEEETIAEVIIPSCIKPINLEPIVASLRRSGRLIVCEEATGTLGWGAELIRLLATKHFDLLKNAPVHVSAMEFPIANTVTLEERILPQVQDIVDAVSI